MTPVSAPEPQEWLALLFFLSFALTYAIYYILSHSEAARRRFNDRFGEDRGSIRFVLLQRAIMFAGAGLLPAAVAWAVGHPPTEYGLRINWDVRHLLVLIALSVVSGATSIFASKPEEKLAAYPQIRTKIWSPGTVVANSLSWGLYLLAYELMFRGFMLYVLLPYGVWTSIAVNTVLYVAVHVPKSGSEAAGAFVYGPVLCLFTLWSGTIWIALFAHIALALGNSYSCLAKNEGMRLRRRAKA